MVTRRTPADEPSEPSVVDRYYLFRPIAAGGMASIHLARLMGPVGFGRTVAVKRLHPRFVREPSFVAMFVDEAHIMTSIRHPNVVAVQDVVSTGGHLFLVMDYIHGEALHRLGEAARARNVAVPASIVSAIGIHLTEGLHAAHEARGPGGTALGVIHRDVSPQNVLVGVDGLARVTDFGIAKAASQYHETTGERAQRGKVRYMSPEQLESRPLDRRADLWSAGVVLWELATGERLFAGRSDGETVRNVLAMPIPKPSTLAPSAAPLDEVILRALSRDVADRFPDGRAMAVALESAVPPASAREVSAWVADLARDALAERQAILDELEIVVKAGMPSVRTQLAVITERASRSRAPEAPPALAPAADDATKPVGGRPLDVPSPSESPSPSEPARRRPLALVLGLVLALGLVLVLVLALLRRA